MPSSGTHSTNYGLDAPGVFTVMLVVGVLGLAVAIAGQALLQVGWVLLAVISAGLIAAAYGFLMNGHMLWSSHIGKLRTRERLLDTLQSRRNWSGSETVLNIGCGRGLMLIGAAKRLTPGKAIGVDIWNAADQLGNSPDAVAENAMREGVAEKITIETADARALPYTDGSVDVVLSHWVVHNLPVEADRTKALDKMWRVLKPGGIIVLADIAHVQSYTTCFRSKGASQVLFERGGWQSALFGILSGGTFRPQAIFVSRD